MNAKEAIKIIRNEYPNMRIIECLEFDTFFAFLLFERELSEDELIGGGYTTVDKKTGRIDTFNPQEDFEAFNNAKIVDIEE